MSAVLMMAGGTGGHVFPALAVADALRAEGLEVAWLGTTRGMEARLLAQQPYPLHLLSIEGLRGRGPIAWLSAPMKLALALMQCLCIVRRLRPRLAVGMGGFASGPGGVAARLLGVPLIIHEQNAIPGTTNRLLARLANRVLQAMPDAFPSSLGAITTGNPVRAAIVDVRSRAAREPYPSGRVRLLVLGGSQGARWLNESLPAALAALGDRPIEIRHQSGGAERAETAARYAAHGLTAEVHDFFDDMAEHYAWADAAVCRAGALTVSELATVGLPSILVPFPHATDNHQQANANWLASTGAAEVLIQQTVREGDLTATLARLIGEPARRHAMAMRALALAQGAATATVTAHCLEFCRDT
ncbi:MAG TPA: undecaprenyldiphospho-muramoylpentapeptide beta-N-acetylglucosaminyltransferase [Gammaproteobacteria bacterium]|nr:undecaprenyldiphospho-muramoylpentapeptide beta-N-acetylglucosaminyltransferase [Gammaproteobacteria bacterium]